MARFIFIFGGVKSGKSSYAIKLACGLGGKVIYIATCTNPDREMKQRIRLHQQKRPPHWRLIEEGKDVNSVLDKIKHKCDVVIIDCLGLLISNLLSDNLKDREILVRLKKLAQSLSKVHAATILVSNETGSGLVPDNLLGRRFCDLIGMANQQMAKVSDEVILMQAGIPLKIK